jgi:hypothetical protein
MINKKAAGSFLSKKERKKVEFDNIKIFMSNLASHLGLM